MTNFSFDKRSFLVYNRLEKGKKMKAVLQRVQWAEVVVNKKDRRKIGQGFVVFLGVGKNDTEKDLNYLVKKICGLRIFKDENDKMNLNPASIGAEMMVISNFTLYANTSGGFRPDFLRSMPPKEAEKFVIGFIEKCQEQQVFKRIESGEFGADMQVTCVNDGPVNIIFDTEDYDK